MVGVGAGRVRVGEETVETTKFSVVRLEFVCAGVDSEEDGDGAFPEDE